MNIDRRKRLQNAIDEINLVLEEEQEAFDNLPESLQGSERGELMQDGIDRLEEIVSELTDIVNG